MKQTLTKRICRAALIAALYVALTYAFMPFAFGPFQIRPAEALCLLPLFFPEAIPGLFIGCALSNIASPFALYDVTIGSLTTLIAAFGTYMVGVYAKKDLWKIIFGGIFPVLFNALIIPIVFVYLYEGGEASAPAYFAGFASILLTQAVWVYGLGSCVYFPLQRLKDTWLHN